MKDKATLKNQEFDSFLNKTIILSSKRYYKYETTRDFTELKFLDDKNYSNYLDNYLTYEDISCNNATDIEAFKEQLENPVLIRALKSLSDIELAVIFLLFDEQLTNIESSKILKICSETVTRIKKRALNKIEKYLKGDE